MYRFARRPKWIVLHLVVLGVVVLFAALGMWQLRRLDDRREHNALVRERRTAPVIAVAELTATDDHPPGLASDDHAWRRVEATGTYDTDEEVLLQGKARDGRPGSHVLTPLVVADGRAVLVDRGWVPIELDQPPVTEAAPPPGEIHASGTLLPNRPASALGPTNPDTGELTKLNRLDVSRLEEQVPYALFPNTLRLQAQDPPQSGALPAPAPLPELSEGPHLSYALQWFAFIAIGLIGYGALLRKEARKEGGSGRDGSEPPREPPDVPHAGQGAEGRT